MSKKSKHYIVDGETGEIVGDAQEYARWEANQNRARRISRKVQQFVAGNGSKASRILRIVVFLILTILLVYALADIFQTSNASRSSVAIVSFAVFSLLFYAAFFRPAIKGSESMAADSMSQIRGAIKAFYISGAPFHCTEWEMCSFSEDLFRQQEKLPTETLRYTTNSGQYYSACTRDPMQFALIAMARYAKEYEHDDLRSFCDKHLVEARVTDIHSH